MPRTLWDVLGQMAGFDDEPSVPTNRWGTLPMPVPYGPRVQFNPDVPLDPSQVRFWTGDQNPWAPWMQGQSQGSQLLPSRLWYDPLPQRDPYAERLQSLGLPTWATGDQYYTPNTTLPWGPRWEQWQQQFPFTIGQ